MSERAFLREVQGSRMRLRADDTGISAHLAEHGIREPTATRAYQAALEARSDEERVTVVDIGANIGYYALQPCAILGEQARVLAIEPDPENVAVLRENVELNDYTDRVTVLEGAVGEAYAEATLRVMEESNLSTLHPDHSSGTQAAEVTVPVRPLDAWCEQAGIPLDEVDVLRMDVEGYEVSILRGADPVLAAADELLCHIEVHPTLFDKADRDYLVDLFETHPPDVHCLATQQPHEQSHDYPGARGLCQRRWSPQLVFDWGLRDYDGLE